MPYPQYRPGDIANGHVLGSDGVWRPLAQPPSTAPQTKAAQDVGRTAAGTTLGCLMVPVVLIAIPVLLALLAFGGQMTAATSQLPYIEVVGAVMVAATIGWLFWLKHRKDNRRERGDGRAV